MKKILLNILTHGNEFVGVKVADELRIKYPDIIGHGLDIQIANERAFERKKRFIDGDLNRLFPGNPLGSYEERRAYELSPIIAEYDCVIDVHSTESGCGDVVVVTRMDDATKSVLELLSPKYVLFMNIQPDRSLISHAHVGIALELGKDADEKTVIKTLQGVEIILARFKLIPRRKSFGFETEYFEVFTQIDKPNGAVLESHVKNFSLIKSGDIFARSINGYPLIAKFDFYPVIFGSANYDTIFGFAANRIK